MDRTGLDWVLVAAALVVSLGLIWLVARQPLVVAGFAGGALLLAALARVSASRRLPPVLPALGEPDWSVTVAAISRPDCAIAVTDRAGRLVCANAAYEDWFGSDHAPPRLAVAPDSLDRLVAAARAAWRDGQGRADDVQRSAEPEDRPLDRHAGSSWTAEAERAGRGEDFLIWRLTPQALVDPVAELVDYLDGKLGRVLAAAGFAAAIVDADGLIRSATAAFAERATGDPHAAMAGQDFVLQLAQDENNRLYWARDEARTAPLTLHYVPLGDPDQFVLESDQPRRADLDSVPSLMLLVDAGTGAGGDIRSAAAPHLEALLGQLPLGLAMTDRDGRLLFANVAFMRAAGCEGQAPPLYPTDLVVREDKAVLADAVRRFAQGPAGAGDLAVRLAAQPEEPVSMGLAGVRGLGEAAVLLSLIDSTEETRLKRQVAQATKMQAVGQLAGGVAHDFNNLLTAIIGTCDMMMLRHIPGDSDYDDIQQIRASSNRAASLTRQLLAFSRQQTLRPEVLQLPDVVSEISQILKRLIGEKIQLVVTHDRNLGPVRADPTQLEQVIVNLVVNARDAIQEDSQRRGGDGSGRVTVATRRISAADVRVMLSEFVPVADYTAMVVEDSGGGIPPEHLGKIFEPFFTTKEQGRGTGLGLSTVYGIIKQSGGFIFADSDPGKGARFSIYLPVYQATAAELAPTRPREEPASWAGGGDILLVEDEDTVRLVAERALSRAGYTVTPARDGEEGLEMFRERAASGKPMFDLVLSDVVMPGMDGPAMVRKMREKMPVLRVLFMSGHAEEQLRRELDIENAQFLAKPFSVLQISTKVGQLLSAPL
ncbi:MAG: ATP-binding protein [Pseudomonadota bacterium]|nr:ATP-binding protein [Pseudomonadota bacterium]